MFESSVGEVAAGDVAGLAATVLGLSAQDVLGGDLASAQSVVAAQRVLNAVAAVQLLGIEAWSRRTGEDIAADRAAWGAAHPGRPCPGPRDEHEFMDGELAPVLHVAPRTAQRTYVVARTVGAVLPATWAAMRAGDLEPARAEAIAQEVPRLRPEVCAQVEQALFPAVLGLPTARLRAAARRAVAVADPGDITARAARARAERFVLVRPGIDPGMSEWVAAQPAETSAAAWAAVDALAHAYVADGEHRRLDQARADAMIDLILGQATITTTVELNLAAPRPARADPAARSRRGHPRRRPAEPRPHRRRVLLRRVLLRRVLLRWHRIPGAGRTGAAAAQGRDRGGPGRADPDPGADPAADRPRHRLPDRAARPRLRRPARRRRPGLPPARGDRPVRPPPRRHLPLPRLRHPRRPRRPRPRHHLRHPT